MYGSHDKVTVPAPPKTAAAAAKLQTQIDQLLAENRTYDAFPWQCQMAMYGLYVLGSEHPATVDSVYTVLVHLQLRGCVDRLGLLEWLLPRCARQHGLDSPQLRQVVEWGAEIIYESPDIRLHTWLTRAVCRLAKLLPGGLEWGGTAVVADIDKYSYGYYSVMQTKARQALEQGQQSLGLAMYGKTLAYFKLLGPHWLGSPRLAQIRSQVRLQACCACNHIHKASMHTRIYIYSPQYIPTRTHTQTHTHTQALSVFASVCLNVA